MKGTSGGDGSKENGWLTQNRSIPVWVFVFLCFQCSKTPYLYPHRTALHSLCLNLWTTTVRNIECVGLFGLISVITLTCVPANRSHLVSWLYKPVSLALSSQIHCSWFWSLCSGSDLFLEFLDFLFDIIPRSVLICVSRIYSRSGLGEINFLAALLNNVTGF